MSRAKLLILEAEKKFEEGDYRGARDAYRASFMEEPPVSRGFGTLEIAEDWEMFRFRSELFEKYPHSSEVKSALAHAYLRVRQPQQAVDLLGGLIEVEVELTRRVPLLLVRFRAALAARQYDVAAVDFVELWMAGARVPAAKRFRKGMLKEVSGLVDGRAESLLGILEGQLSGESLLMAYVAAKRSELRAIAGLISTFS
ncbi:hypothetical protein HUA76_39735 [Myxococcus sp. CA056]|uniref:hypothetical protein n=1 Tax=Myxococcus sp. CA056 TaxID=2741740 RepID=UPI00157A5EC0|nr:hypothetical protein [Myxococcus sp. CA056]NTX16923.1 hypothetical protein [Myxococcus sp. CA056]